MNSPKSEILKVPTRAPDWRPLRQLSSICLLAIAIASQSAATFGEQPKIPGIMLPELTVVTPEMIAKIIAASPREALAKPQKPRKVLIFSKCEDFTHHSISVAEKALAILGERTGAFSTEVSYDYSVFESGKLAAYDAIVLNNCEHLDIPAGSPRNALMDFVNNGKGFVAIHSAVQNFGDFPEAKEMMGGSAAGHPWGHYLSWRFKVEEPTHPITAHFDPNGFSMKDTVYQFDQRNTGRHNLRILVSVDMSDPITARDEKGNQRGFRTDGLNPVVWIRQAGKGRVFVNGFGNNDELFWDSSMLKLNLAGIQYALGDLKVDDTVSGLKSAENRGATSVLVATEAGQSLGATSAGGAGLSAAWWNNNTFSGDPVLTNRVTKYNPIVDDSSAPFPKSVPALGPEGVTARLTGRFIPKVTGEYKFVTNADDYVALWVNGAEEIAWSGHTAQDRFSIHSFKLVAGDPLEIRVDYRQDKMGYKLTLRLAHQPDGLQSDFGGILGGFTPPSMAAGSLK